MKRILMILSLVALIAASVSFAGEGAWFDMENCAMCTNLSSNPELMMNISWEQHPISNGVIAVSTVDEKYVEAYRKAHAAMVETGMRMQKGEKLEMCGSCMALGKCMMKGPNQEYVETLHGDVWILTSDDAELVAELQAWAARNTEEMAKMHSHEG